MLEMYVVLLVILIALSGFFSGVETALMSINMVKARSLVKQKKKGSEALFRLKQNPRKLLITILLGNNLVNIGAASIATVVFTDLFGSSGIGIATGIMTFFILVFGEITPKSFATQNAERMSLFVARPIELLGHVLFPIVRALEGIASVMLRVTGSKKEKELSGEEIKTIVTMGYEEGILTREVAEMMGSLLKFEGTKVEEVMTPKSEIAFVDGNARLRDVVDFVIKTPFSKYPAYLKTKDKVIGILDVDDVLRYIKRKSLDVRIKNIVRKAYFVPETKEIDDLLTEFQKRKTPIAVIVDEYGSVLGMVTMEDVLEEIVGDIFDKSLRREVYIRVVGKKTIRADARATVSQVERALGVGLKEKHFNTIAGVIEHKLGRIPKRGEVIELQKVSIVVEKTSKQRIEKVKIIKK